MKKLILLLFFLFSISGFLYPQTFGKEGELYFNYMPFEMHIRIFPISMVMNGKGQYNLLAQHRLRVLYEDNDENGNTYLGPAKTFDYNVTNLVLNNTLCNVYVVDTSMINEFTLNYDNDYHIGYSAPAESFGTYGPGVYKIVFERSINRDSIIIENDGSETNDMALYFKNGSLYYLHAMLGYEVRVHYDSLNSYWIKLWDPYRNNPDAWRRAKSLDYLGAEAFKYDEGEPYNVNGYTPNPYTTIPQDARLNCDQNWYTNHITQNHEYPEYYFMDEVEERQGTLTLNLDIKKDVSSPTSFDPVYNQPHVVPAIRITDGAKLKICTSTNGPRTLTLNQYTGYNIGGQILVEPNSYLWLDAASSYANRARVIMNAYCYTTVNPNGWLVMANNSEFIINDHSQLTLENGSHFAGTTSSRILVYPNGVFCNRGAIISGQLNVKYIGGIYVLQCDGGVSDSYFNDSTNIVLSEGATLEIPDNKVYHFQGPETVLQMDSNSTIKFGANSKIVFENGARISAKYSKFTSLTSNATWTGIYLKDISHDTITNCIIENAVEGISIKGKLNSSGSFSSSLASTEISNCSFINSTTSSQLTNAIYVFNSSDVLLKGNTVSSTSQTNGYSIGIWLEYCSPQNVNVVNNTLNNTLNGINILQSSPFVTGNTISGQTSSTYGMFLDNCNSSIKNNSVSYFNNSVSMAFSSPYLYSNTFANAVQSNIFMRKTSIPVMSPVISGTAKYWYGGRNIISGSPSNSMIVFGDESYPSMDNGYNTIYSGTSTYMAGDLPSSQDGLLYATLNYWNNANFNPDNFTVTSGTVTYEPLFSGNDYPPIDGFIVLDYGFGIYDTVYYSNAGDNSGSSLFLQAMNKENLHQYTDAITQYKEVISTYKNSEYASLSVTSIFNCLQKMGGDLSRYTTNNGYLAGIKNNNDYPIMIRELAEDYIIKGKARTGYVSDAIADYETIYQQNQNNQKGFHALLNKTCLEAFINDTLGDNHGTGFSDSKHKNALLNILKLRTKEQLSQNGNSGIPKDFSLEQNYPNPFNPVTKIAYSIPKESRVTLVVYDLLGREIAKLVNNETKKAGTYIVEFNAFSFASGVYFYRIQAGNYVQTKRMVLVK
jgi:hypothetical protein